MPNHITNVLTIQGEKRLVKFVFQVIEGNQENQFIDFNKIIPAPAFCFNKPSGINEEKLCKEFGTDIWLNFNRKNWGTKWNAYSQEKVSENELRFETAWSSSAMVIKAIADKFPSLKITLKYADEDTGANVGVLIWENNAFIENIPENFSKHAYDIYFELHPDDKKHYVFTGGKYQYADED